MPASKGDPKINDLIFAAAYFWRDVEEAIKEQHIYIQYLPEGAWVIYDYKTDEELVRVVGNESHEFRDLALDDWFRNCF